MTKVRRFHLFLLFLFGLENVGSVIKIELLMCNVTENEWQKEQALLTGNY